MCRACERPGEEMELQLMELWRNTERGRMLKDSICHTRKHKLILKGKRHHPPKEWNDPKAAVEAAVKLPRSEMSSGSEGSWEGVRVLRSDGDSWVTQWSECSEESHSWETCRSHHQSGRRSGSRYRLIILEPMARTQPGKWSLRNPEFTQTGPPLIALGIPFFSQKLARK